MKLIFLVILLLAAAVLQWQSNKRCLETLEVGLGPSLPLVEPEEPFEAVVTFTNKGRLFIPFLRYRVFVPKEFTAHVDSGHLYAYTGYMEKRYVTGTTWLGPRQRLEKRFPVSVSKRGCWRLSELVVCGGDFLGLKEQPRTFNSTREVVVYPRAASRQEIAQVFGGFLGELSVRRFIQEDPVLTLGYREYTGREPMKTISWTQSARRGELMVKKFDYTLEPSVSVILNVESGEEGREEKLERCFSLARSVCEELESKGVKYDFRMNALTTGSLREAEYFSEGLGSGHYYGILEYLGRATYLQRRTCRSMLEKAERSMTTGRGIVFITPGDNAEMEASAERLAERNGGTLLILTAREAGLC